MILRWSHILSSLIVLVALSQDWLIGELFWNSATLVNIVLALAINGAIVTAVYFALATFWSERRSLIGLQTFTYAVFLQVSLSPFPYTPLFVAVGLVVIALLVTKLDHARSQRLLHAAAVASIAFALVPLIWLQVSAQDQTWIPPTRIGAAGHEGGAVVVLLFDELGYSAAAPLASDLQAGGLRVRYEPLKSAGHDTHNVIPALFTGQDFSQARPCGPTTQCSGVNHLDYSRIWAGRTDIDVAGLRVPYCAIRGLRSCYSSPVLHGLGGAYASMMSWYLGHMRLSLPVALMDKEDPVRNGKLLNAEMAFVRSAPMWTQGGVLYAHLPLPHPPGLGGPTTLDADYAANVEESRRITAELVGRLRATFGDQFTLVIFSDHGLRSYWRERGPYPMFKAGTRPQFHDVRVPLIVASPSAPTSLSIKSNAEIFRVVRAEVTRILDEEPGGKRVIRSEAPKATRVG